MIADDRTRVDGVNQRKCDETDGETWILGEAVRAG